jgi:hypothetical protein
MAGSADVRLTEMLRKAWMTVMNPEQNGLKSVPKIVRFQLMAVLSLFWSVIFCLSVGIMQWLPGYIAVHIVLLLVGIFGTGWILQLVQRQP